MPTALPTPPFIRAIRLGSPPGYTAQIPALRALERLELDPKVTFFVGENGSGKSTLVEAIAVAAKLNAEGGGHVLRGFSTRSSHSGLHRALELEWAPVKPVNRFFLRAESLYNYASVAESGEGAFPMEDVFARPLHEQSHGESFLDVVVNRFGPRGLYVLDEPEAALSVRGTMALMRRVHELVREDSQFVIATHSPILLGFPGATIYELSDDGILRREYEQTEQVELTRSFLEDRDRFLRYLLED